MNTWRNTNQEKIKNLVDKIKQANRITIYDTETSGLKKATDRILQFSGIQYELPSWEEVKRIDIYIKAPFSVYGLEACKINHISDELLEERGISEKEAFLQIKDFFTDAGIIAGYNNQKFDDGFIEALYKDHKESIDLSDTFDIYTFAKLIIPPEEVIHENVRGKMMPSYKLCYTTEYFDKDNTINFHSAISDVEATVFVLRECIKKYEAESEENKSETHVGKQLVTVEDAKIFNPSEKIKRVYINTSQGTIYYDTILKRWEAKTGNIKSINMPYVLEQIFEKYDIENESELFSAVKGKNKDNGIKERLWKRTGINTNTEKGFYKAIDKLLDLVEAYDEVYQKMEEINKKVKGR